MQKSQIKRIKRLFESKASPDIILGILFAVRVDTAHSGWLR